MLNYRKIEEFFEKKKYRKVDLIKFMKISDSTFHSKMKEKTLKPDELEQIAIFLGKPIDYFFDREDLQVNQVAEPPASYSCQKCVEKQKIIKGLNATIKHQEELLMLYRQINPDNVSGFEKSCG